MTRRFVFTDEAGNFDFSSSGSRYFIITTLTLDSCEVGHELIDLRRQLSWENLPLGARLHATEDKQSIRDRVFALLEPREFRVDATIYDKPKVSPRNRESHGEFYKFALFYHWRALVNRISAPGDEIHAINPSIGNARAREKLLADMQDPLRQTASGRTCRADVFDAHSDPCIVVADYCCWAIQRKWERGDDRSRRLIAHNIVSEFDIFEDETARYF